MTCGDWGEELGLAGNAWLLEEDPKGKNRLAMGHGTTVEVCNLFLRLRNRTLTVEKGSNLAEGASAAAFKRSNDWNAFDKALGELNGRVASGWKRVPLVKRLQGLVRAQAALKEVPPLQGEGLSAADQALAWELVLGPDRGGGTFQPYMMHHLWILGNWREERAGVASNHPAGRILMRGTNSIPLLLAMLGDATLTILNRQDNPFELDLSC